MDCVTAILYVLFRNIYLYYFIISGYYLQLQPDSLEKTFFVHV